MGGLQPYNAILKTVALDPFELFKLILLILGIPLISGMLVNYKFPETSKKIERILKPFSMMVFLGLIVGAFYENIDIFLNYIYLVAALVIFHNIGAYIIGYYTAKSFGLQVRERKTIAIETGIQNGSWTITIFDFFQGLAEWRYWQPFGVFGISSLE